VTDSTLWPAPTATEPVRATVTVPGSKSMTNRALVLAAIADRPGVIVNPLRARDTLLMRGALTALGAAIDDLSLDGRPAWRVMPGQPRSDTSVDVGNAGTVMRFVPPVAALTSVSVAFRGDARASERPVGPMLTALRELGAVIHDDARAALPFTVRGTGSLAGGAVTLNASASSQLISGLLLAAPRFDKGAEVRHQGPKPPSTPHIAMTVQMLREAGAVVDTWARGTGTGPAMAPAAADTWCVQPGAIGFDQLIVQPDVSNAVPFLAAALVTGGTVTVRDWPAVTAQPAGEILGLLRQMGADCELGGEGMVVTGGGTIHGIDASLADASESALVVAALAALADSPSRLTGIGHMRTHETDRLAAFATEINALGADVTELPDGLRIRPRPLRCGGRPFGTYDDHRMVMAAAVVALAVPGIGVRNAATVGKTFPSFIRSWETMLERRP
jgi:3-phosphoshikimate 1-carboxyvinyltransferase